MTTSVFLDSDEISVETWAVKVSRGKSLETDVIDAGTATISVRNFYANFNPSFLLDSSALLLESGDLLLQENGDKILLESVTNSSGDYSDIKLGRELVVKDGTTTVFTGFVQDIDFSYERLKPTAEIVGVDALATLGATTTKEDWETDDSELTGSRLTSLLDRDDVGFPSGGAARSITTGTQPTMRHTVPVSTNALQYAQDVASTELGRLFVNRTGRLDFTDRYEAFGQTPAAAFTDDDTALPISAIGVRFGTESFFFSVTAQRLGDEAVTETDAGVKAQYPTLGARNFNLGNLLSDSQNHARGNAQFLLSRLSQSLAVVSGLRIPLPRLSPSDRTTVCGLDIGDTVTLQWTPYGAAGVVFQTLVIEGVDYEADSTGDAVIEFQLSDASDPGYFVVGTSAVDGPDVVAP